ncbi:calcium-binding and coiled-coil domain-containing protein 1-like isoform X2 [Hippocampus comes]|uniref:calcium-binding and coiled-coil domain-containing protein 1-like isoform X2 n=1 Tax=Hippocampus comes TaxID=109280 RepID=UPI00094EB11A|nr:PREDICTED: calcium-binding and coiled-coil domain-containing protein 1-like isoform X2 [Hippocampus comes]
MIHLVNLSQCAAAGTAVNVLEKTTIFSACAVLLVTVMEKNNPESAVVFRNVGQRYFPQTRVECHYSLTSAHQWSSRDWIGIFKVGWSSLREYHTYSWSLVPEGYTERSAVDCCSLFQAFYLPRPSTAEYHFVYVDKMGQVCAQSQPFTFCSPKPLDELETLSEERNEEEEGAGDDEDDEELLLVVPRAQLLQSQLEECLREKAQLQQAVQEARQEIEEEWESERDALKEEIEQLRQNLTCKCDALKKMEENLKDVESSQENLNSELSQLKVLTDREKKRNVELERVKEVFKEMFFQLSGQKKLNQEKIKLLEAEREALQSEVRSLQALLEESKREAEGFHRQLGELELHKSHLQMAQLSLQLSAEKRDCASWTLEREALRNVAQQSDQQGDKKQVMLPALVDPVFSELTGSIMW